MMPAWPPVEPPACVHRGSILRAVSIAMVCAALAWTCSPSGARTLATIDSLRSAGKPDSADVLTRSLLRHARASGDSLLHMDLAVRIGQRARFFGMASEAEPVLREALHMARVRADTSRMLAALRWLCVTVELQGRGAEARDLSRQLVDLAEAAGDARHIGWGSIGLGWHALQDGRASEAERLYEQAEVRFTEAGDVEGTLWSLMGLGLIRTRTWNLAGAVAAYEQAVRLARDSGQRLTEAHARNDIAAIEFYRGDPVQAMAQFEWARAVHAELGSLRETIRPTLNIALCLGELGRFNEAEETLRGGLELCRRSGSGDLEPLVMTHLARLSARQGRAHEAARRFLEILEAADEGRIDPLAIRNRLQCLEGAAEALTATGRPDTALVLLARASELVRIHADREMAARIGLRTAQALCALDRWEDGLREASLALRAAIEGGQNEDAIDALVEAAAAWRALGVPDSARVSLVAAAEIWERHRARSLDPTWRERRGIMGPRICTSMAMLMLGRGGVRDDGARGPAVVTQDDAMNAVFDRLQVFKSRTLLERMSAATFPPGAEGGESARKLVTLAELQKGVMHAGELFLDFHLGPDTSLVIAATQDTVMIIGLPPAGEVDPRLLYYHQLLSHPPGAEDPRSERESIRSAGRALAMTLLGGLEEIISNCTTVIVAPDGRIGLVPMGELYSHIHACASRNPAPAPDWIRVPSASVFARAREASRAVPSDPARLLVVSGERGTGNRPLEGCELEARQLARDYRDVRVMHAPSDSAALSDQMLTADVLHFASHLALDERHPWQSELCFCAPGAPGNLAAGEVAAMCLPARLVVLSNCSSGAGQVLSGEGILGVSSAFASAGVPAIVATLWPVDDRTTAALMRRFYRELLAGATTAEALSAAQAHVASGRDTGHPFFWAGFAVIGDGDVRVKLVARPAFTRLAAPAGVAVLLVIPLLLPGAARRLFRCERRRRPAMLDSA